MLKKAAIPLLGLLIVVLVGCATSKMAGPPADVNGTADGPIKGLVEGNSIRLWEADSYGSTPALLVKGDQITGWVRGTTLTLRRVSR